MHRFIGRAAAALSVVAFVAAVGVSSVAAAAAKTTYEAVGGNFGKMAAATAYQAKLTKAGFKGYIVEKEDWGTKGHYQVERPFATKAAAQAEVAKLKAAKYRGGVETDKAGSV